MELIVFVLVAFLLGAYVGHTFGLGKVTVERTSPSVDYRLSVTAERTDLTREELERIADAFDASSPPLV